MSFRIILFQVLLWFSYEILQSKSSDFLFDITMPGVMPKKDNAYLNIVKEAPKDFNSIIGFEPLAEMSKVHHMILHGCPDAYDDSDGEKRCTGGESFLYAWARGAPPLQLPKDVGFKIGKNTKAAYINLQVHYANALQEPDFSGIRLHLTNVQQPKSAGIFLLGTAGYISENSSENFEVTCKMKDDVEMHVFAYRTHTHELGKKVSGYIVRSNNSNNNTQDWILMGEKDPLLPQYFYPAVSDDIKIKQNDILAARCMMHNPKSHKVYIGSTSEDEMCNFYIMYSVDNDKFPSFNDCFSSGPPYYHWKTDNSLKNIPQEENLPDVSNSVKILKIDV